MKLLVLFTLIWPAAVFAVPTEGHKIMIAGPSPIAMEAGRSIARQGGNAVDVAVAVGFALSVTSPYYASLGGGGFALVKMTDAVQALDFRETAPGATSKTYFEKLDKDSSITGGHAIGVPGYVAGLWALHKKYGRVPWSKVIAPAIELATKGIPVTGEWVRVTTYNKPRFSEGGKSTFLKKTGASYLPGEVLRQPGLAKALRLVSQKGEAGFYTGPVAQDIVLATRVAKGMMSLEDLKTYKVRWLTPMSTDFEGHKIFLMPPPSSGGVIITSALKLIEMQGLKKKDFLSADELHLLGEIGARAFRGRSLLADPDYHKNPINYLLSEAYLKELNESIQLKKSKELKPLAGNVAPESSETTHFSVLDSEGRAVSLTVTLNGFYGSGVVSKAYGIALNNEMDDFTTRAGEPNMFELIQGDPNSVEPGKRPLSSMSPALVEKDGKVIMSLGSPGGPRIVSAVLQVLYRSLVTGLDMDQAIQAPRVHHQFQPHKLFVDKNRLSPEILKDLRGRGHEIVETSVAKVYGVRLGADGVLEAAFDSRGEGGAGGF